MDKFNEIRYNIFTIMNSGKNTERSFASKIYDFGMVIVIILSLIPLLFKEEPQVFYIIDKITVVIFLIDYILRWMTADYALDRKGFSFVKYPITPFAIIDLLSILPSLTFVANTFRLFRLFRLAKSLKVFRVFKFFRYSQSIVIIGNVIKGQKKVLGSVATLAIAYIFIVALIIFNVEPDTFNNFFDALYWACVSLTSGIDAAIYPQSVVARILTMLSSLVAIVIIALPSAVITAGFFSELEKRKDNKDNQEKIEVNDNNQ